MIIVIVLYFLANLWGEPKPTNLKYQKMYKAYRKLERENEGYY